MGRIFKWALIIAGGLIIIAVIAVYIILSTYNFNNLKPMIARTVKEATGRQLTINSNINLKIGLTPSLVLSGIEFQNAPWGSRPEMIKVKSFEVKVALIPLIRGNIEVKRFILKNPDILIETSKTGKTNLEFKPSEAVPGKKTESGAVKKQGMQLPGIIVNEMEIVDGRLTYRDDRTGKTEDISLKKLTAHIKGLDQPLIFNLDGSYNNTPFKVSGYLGNINGIMNPKIVLPVKLIASAFDATVAIEGSIKDPTKQTGIDLGFNLKVNNWKDLSKLAGQEIPLKDPLSVSGHVNDSAPGAYKIKDLKISMGNNNITGAVGINISKKIPYLDVVLASKNLDLKGLMAANEGKKGSSGGKVQPSHKNNKIFPDAVLPFNKLKLVNGRFRLNFDKMTMPKIVVNNMAIDASMKDGNMEIKPFKANAGGGEITLTLKLSPLAQKNTDAFNADLKVKGLAVGDMLKDAGISNVMEGTINMGADLSGRGNSVASIMAGLNGYTRVIMGNGKINNKYIDVLGGGLSNSIFRLLNPAHEKKDYTAIRCMVNRFDIHDGIANATAFVVDTDLMTVVGEGNINLKTEKLNLSLNPSSKGGVAGFNLSLGELAKPFKLGGTLASPSLELDKEKAALAIGKIIGGTALAGPVGIAAALVGKSGSTGENACVAAVEAAKTGVKESGKTEATKKKEASPNTQKNIIENVIKEPGKALKSLFGN